MRVYAVENGRLSFDFWKESSQRRIDLFGRTIRSQTGKAIEAGDLWKR